MTDPLLNYQTPSRTPSGGWCTAAWIASLILGIFYCIGGILVGLGAVLGMMFALRVGGRGNLGIVLAMFGAILLYIFGNGVLFIIGAFRVRRASRGWAVALLVISSLNALVNLILVIIGAIALLSHSHDPGAFLAILVYLFPVAAGFAAAALLLMMLREERRAMRSLSERLSSPEQK